MDKRQLRARCEYLFYTTYYDDNINYLYIFSIFHFITSKQYYFLFIMLI